MRTQPPIPVGWEWETGTMVSGNALWLGVTNRNTSIYQYIMPWNLRYRIQLFTTFIMCELLITASFAAVTNEINTSHSATNTTVTLWQTEMTYLGGLRSRCISGLGFIACRYSTPRAHCRVQLTAWAAEYRGNGGFPCRTVDKQNGLTNNWKIYNSSNVFLKITFVCVYEQKLSDFDDFLADMSLRKQAIKTWIIIIFPFHQISTVLFLYLSKWEKYKLHLFTEMLCCFANRHIRETHGHTICYINWNLVSWCAWKFTH